MTERQYDHCANCGLVVWFNDQVWVHDGTPSDDPTRCPDGGVLVVEDVR